MKATNIGQGRFEPTVFGAVRRYRIMVFVIAFLTAATAAGYAFGTAGELPCSCHGHGAADVAVAGRGPRSVP